MAGDEQLREVSIFTAQAFAHLPAANVSIYLPGQRDESPVLYRGHRQNMLDINFERLETTGVDHLLIDAHDLARCERALESQLRDLLANPLIEPRQKASSVHHAGLHIARDLILGAHQPAKLARATAMIDAMIDGVLGKPEIGQILLAMSAHHQSTAGHLFAVGALSAMLAYEVVGFKPQVIRSIALAGMLHDLGKISIEAELLSKRGPLTAGEIDLVRQHPVESVRLLGDDPSADAFVRRMILQHHERYDGSGYPLGLAGDEIDFGARIIAITDSFHAMIGRRAYRDPLGSREAIRTMRSNVGRHFDPHIFACWEEFHRRSAVDDCLPVGSAPSAAPDMAPGYHADHRAARKGAVHRRSERKAVPANIHVRCLRTGGLQGVSARLGRQECPILDLSRSGACLDLKEPMYQGEVVSVQIAREHPHQWLRGVVRWCRRMSSPDWPFRAGLQFAHRISAAEAHSEQPVVGIVEAQEMLVAT